MNKPLILLAVFCALAACSNPNDDAGTTGDETSPGDADAKLLAAFEADAPSSLNVTIDGSALAVTAYSNLVYTANPIAITGGSASGPGGPPPGGIPGDPPGEQAASRAAATDYPYQSLNLFIPETASTETPVFITVNNAGWRASQLSGGVSDGASLSSQSSPIGAALAAGCVAAVIGTRGRDIYDAGNNYVGKAPACVVDAKAAIRYIRLLANKGKIPGNTGRIFISGTSGGGGLAAAVGASGNSGEYEAYLREIGAATPGDDVYGVIAYCPITDLGNADALYEWTYGAARAAQNQSAENIAASEELALQAADYINSLGIQGVSAGSLAGIIEGLVRAEIERQLASGNAVSADWFTASGNSVTGFDYVAWLLSVAAGSALKDAPAFDQSALRNFGESAGENSLFGETALPYGHFTAYGWNNDGVSGNGLGADDTGMNWEAFTATAAGQNTLKQIDLVNPLYFLAPSSAAQSDVAAAWYIRHGMKDRDTSFAVPALLSEALGANSSVAHLNVKLPWNQGHGGDYDVAEAWEWISQVQ